MKKLGSIYNGKTDTLIHVFQDTYNPKKFWLVKKSKSRHYWYRRLIDAVNRDCYLGGELVDVYDSRNACNSKWTRTTRSHLEDVGIIDKQTVI